MGHTNKILQYKYRAKSFKCPKLLLALYPRTELIISFELDFREEQPTEISNATHIHFPSQRL